jgi:hypothetical protein
MAAHKREMSNARPKEVRLFAGTRKGGLTFTSDLRRKNWKVAGPFFAGGEVNYLGRDSRRIFMGSDDQCLVGHRSPDQQRRRENLAEVEQWNRFRQGARSESESHLETGSGSCFPSRCVVVRR